MSLSTMPIEVQGASSARSSSTVSSAETKGDKPAEAKGNKPVGSGVAATRSAFTILVVAKTGLKTSSPPHSRRISASKSVAHPQNAVPSATALTLGSISTLVSVPLRPLADGAKSPAHEPSHKTAGVSEPVVKPRAPASMVSSARTRVVSVNRQGKGSEIVSTASEMTPRPGTTNPLETGVGEPPGGRADTAPTVDAVPAVLKPPGPSNALSLASSDAQAAPKRQTSLVADGQTSHSSSGVTVQPVTAGAMVPATPSATVQHTTRTAGGSRTVPIGGAVGTTAKSTGPAGWKIQGGGVTNSGGSQQSSWTIRPPNPATPPMTMQLTQHGSTLKADLLVNTAAMGLINASPTALPHHAVHLPEGVSTLQWSVSTQSGMADSSGQGNASSSSYAEASPGSGYSPAAPRGGEVLARAAAQPIGLDYHA